jgi:hypothetical protein
MTITLLLYFIGFVLVYMTADALHDAWNFKDKGYAQLSVNNSLSEAERESFRQLSLRYNKRWHALDSLIKGFVIVVLLFSQLGLSWWIAILVFDYIVIRWIWFDACWNWFNGLSFWYRGTVAASDSLKISNKVFFILKFSLLAGSLIVTYLMI